MNALFAWFESLVPAFPPQHPSPAPTKLVAFCLHYIHGLKKYLAIVAFTTVLMAVAEVGLYAILGQLVDWLAAQDKTDFFQREKWTIIGLFAYLLIFMPTLVLFHSSMINQGFMGNLPMRVRWLGHRYLLSQSWQFYQNEFSGRIATKLMQTSLGVRECILKLVNVLLFIAVYLISTIVLVGSLEWRLSLPLLVWIALYFAILKFFLPRLKQIAMLQADSRSEMTGRIVDSYTNVMTLKLFSQHDFDADYARHSMQEFLTTVHPQMRLVTWLNLSVWIINMLLIASIVSIALYYWFYGDMSAAAIAVAMSIGIRISGMSHWIMWEVSNLFENIGTVKDGLNTLSKPTQVEDAEQARPLQIQQAEIRFQQLGFSYHSDNHQANIDANANASENASPHTQPEAIFDKLNLTIKAGEKVGLIGHSGAGKTSLTNLLLRFYDIQQGQILIDQQDIASVTQQSLRQQIGVVTQDTSLLHRSIFDNIAIAKPDATLEEVQRVAKLAYAHEFIMQLEDADGRTGYQAHVGERGVKLSGGQRQRIAIARVLLKNAPIIILDEATSALDSQVEKDIHENLERLMQGKTVIAIAHRLSTIAAMDRLVVLDKGKIVEQGSHSELLAQGGIYADLWHKQAGGFIAAD